MLRKILSFTIFLFLLSLIPIPKVEAASSAQLLNVGLVDVTASPYNADPTCGRDSTQAIQKAMDYAFQKSMVTFFPSGTYCVSNTLEGLRIHGKSGRTQVYELVGSNASTPPVIKLKANSPGFNNPNSPKPVIWLHTIRGIIKEDGSGTIGEENPENGFLQSIRNLEIKVEEGNSGAVGVEFWGAQRNSLLSVRVELESGFAGFAGMIGTNSAISDLEVVGGRHGITSIPGNFVEYPSLTNVRLYNQTDAAITNFEPKQWLFSGLHIKKNSAPAIVVNTNTDHSEHFTLHDAMIEFTSSNGEPAIKNISNRSIALINVYFKNASKLIDNPSDVVVGGNGWKRLETYGYAGNGKNLINGEITTDRFTLGVTEGTPPADLLTVHSINPSNYPTPDVILDRVASGDKNYANVIDYGILPANVGYENTGYGVNNNSSPDVTEKLQALIDSGVEYIFFPKGKYIVSKTIEMKEKTHFMGVANQISGIAASDNWKPTSSNPGTLLRTPDSASASPKISFFALTWRTDPPYDHMNPAIHIRSGKTIMLDVDPRPDLDNSTTDLQPNVRILMDGNAGGKFYALSLHANQNRNQHPGYRHLKIDNTKNPLILYAPNPEDHDYYGSVGGWGVEIVNAKNVAIYGAKNENHNTMYIHNSDNIATLTISNFDNVKFENVPNAIGSYYSKGIPGHENQEHLTEVFGGNSVIIQKRFEVALFVRGKVNFDNLKFNEDYVVPGLPRLEFVEPKTPGWLIPMRRLEQLYKGPRPTERASDNTTYCGPNGPQNSPVLGDESIYTALGCIPVGTASAFTAFFIGRALVIGGGLTFLLIIYASIMFMTSTGDPKKVGAAKELFTASVSGLLLIIFSVILLRVFGLDILQLPGF